ncbi:MAG: carbohydrate ABC transporter permease, partial [Streptomyces sp.]
MSSAQRTPGQARRGRRLGRTGQAAQYAALICYLVFLAFPLFWLISTAFKAPQELGSVDPAWLPEHPSLDSFTAAFGQQPLARSALNSLIVAGSAAAISVAVAVPAAYAMVRYRSPVSKAATGWIL